MTAQLTFDEWRKLRVYPTLISNFEVDNIKYKSVVYKVEYEDEVKVFQAQVKVRSKLSKDDYIQKAFRKVRTQVVEWVKSQSATSILNIQLSFQLEYFNAPNGDDSDNSDNSDDGTEEKAVV